MGRSPRDSICSEHVIRAARPLMDRRYLLAGGRRQFLSISFCKVSLQVGSLCDLTSFQEDKTNDRRQPSRRQT